MPDVDVQISSIQSGGSTLNNGHLPNDEIRLGLKYNKETHELTVRWIIKLNIETKHHIDHVSKTIFSIKGMDLDMLTPDDPRLTLLVPLCQMSLAHSRAMFVVENSGKTKFIPLILWDDEIKQQLVTIITAGGN